MKVAAGLFLCLPKLILSICQNDENDKKMCVSEKTIKLWEFSPESIKTSSMTSQSGQKETFTTKHQNKMNPISKKSKNLQRQNMKI